MIKSLPSSRFFEFDPSEKAYKYFESSEENPKYTEADLDNKRIRGEEAEVNVNQQRKDSENDEEPSCSFMFIPVSCHAKIESHHL